MLRFIFWTLLFFWISRIVFNFVLPLFRATRQMRQQVRDFQERTGQQSFSGNTQTAPSNNPPPKAQPQPKPRREDYIDFEELK